MAKYIALRCDQDQTSNLIRSMVRYHLLRSQIHALIRICSVDPPRAYIMSPAAPSSIYWIAFPSTYLPLTFGLLKQIIACTSLYSLFFTTQSLDIFGLTRIVHLILPNFAAFAVRSKVLHTKVLSKGNEMPFYQELGRHTPPPPPYSLGQRDSTNTKSTCEAMKRSDPPPPPPSLSSTPKADRKIPPINELGRTRASDDSYLLRNGNAIPLPPVPFQRPAEQTLNAEQHSQDYAMIQYYESIRYGVPVEPKLAPGFRGGPLRPSNILALDSGSHSAPQQNFNQGTGLRSDHETYASQSPRTLSLGHNLNSCATQPLPHALVIVNQQPLPTFRRHSSTNITSLTNATTLDAPAHSQASRTLYRPFPVPLQQATEKRATPTMVPTLQVFDAAEATLGVGSLLDPDKYGNSHGGLSTGSVQSPRSAAVPRGQAFASPAQSYYEPRPIQDHPTSQGRDRGQHVPYSSHRRPSASLRFEPYKRRQSQAAEKLEQRPGGAVEERHVKSLEMDSDVEMNEDEEGEEEEEADRRH